MEFFKLDTAKEWKAEGAPGKAPGVVFLLFGLAFAVIPGVLIPRGEMTLVTTLVLCFFLAGGAVFLSCGLVNLIKAIREQRRISRIVREGDCTYAYVCRVVNSSVRRGDSFRTKCKVEYEYRDREGNRVRDTFAACYSGRDVPPVLHRGRRIVVAFLGAESVFLSKYHFVGSEPDREEKPSRPQTTRSFKGLTRETVDLDRSKWYMTSALSKAYFIITLCMAGLFVVCAIPALSVCFSSRGRFGYIVAALVVSPAFLPMSVFLILTVAARAREKRIFRTAKFTYAKVYPMQTAYAGGEERYVTYCYVDDKGRKQERRLKKHYFIRTIGSVQTHYAAYTDDGESLLVMKPW